MGEQHQMIAWWQINEDGEVLSLQIELGSDRVVMLTINKNGDGLNATILTDNREDAFGNEALASFRQWLGERPMIRRPVPQ
jgi:hypothetical protein